MATKLFVGNLSFNTTEGEVLDLFQQAGTVASCSLIVDKFTNKSRGGGFGGGSEGRGERRFSGSRY